MKITEEELKQRRERIINTAFQLFCQHGIEKVTLSTIAKKSQVGESTIYRYFTNKPLLVLATLSVLWRSIGGQLERSADQYPNYSQITGLKQISLHLEAFRQLYLNNADYIIFSYEAKLYLQRNGIALTKEDFDQLMDEIKEPCMASLRKGIADKSISVDEDLEDIFYAIWGSVRGYIVKIVIYDALCSGGNPWVGRYSLLERGILSALSNGWKDINLD